MDEYCRQVVDDNRNMLVPWWLMATYAYEELSQPLISDALYDEIAERLTHEWDSILHHHRRLLNRDALKGRLGFRGRQWPPRIMSAALLLLNNGPPEDDESE